MGLNSNTIPSVSKASSKQVVYIKIALKIALKKYRFTGVEGLFPGKVADQYRLGSFMPRLGIFT